MSTNSIINEAIELVKQVDLTDEDKEMVINAYKLLTSITNDNFIDIPEYNGNFDKDGFYYDIPFKNAWYFDSYRRTVLLAVCCIKDGSRFYPLTINIENNRFTDVYELFISHQGRMSIPRVTLIKTEDSKILESTDISNKTLSSLVDLRTLE